jgi:hypothetical protein
MEGWCINAKKLSRTTRIDPLKLARLASSVCDYWRLSSAVRWWDDATVCDAARGSGGTAATGPKPKLLGFATIDANRVEVGDSDTRNGGPIPTFFLQQTLSTA